MCSLDKRGNIFILTVTGEDEHRLNPTLITSLLSALSQAKAQATRGSVLVTLSQGKFFSNGFDLAWAQSAGSKEGASQRLHQMVLLFKPIVTALLNIPMPTIAAVTGHASAAGFLLALSHDYIFMRRDRGVLYMSEVDLGLTIPDYFNTLFKEKIAAPSTRRDIFLKGMKIKGEEAEKKGIVEAALDGEDHVRKASVQLGEDLAKRKWNGDVYAEIRKGLYPETCSLLGVETKAIVASSKL